jgi:hypothetical protein
MYKTKEEYEQMRDFILKVESFFKKLKKKANEKHRRFFNKFYRKRN